MTRKISISAIIIARNEETRIGKCLEGVVWADERIVIDNGSTDETIKTAQKHGAVVIEGKNQDFSLIRNLGAKHAAGEWLLYVDADEVVTDLLRQEIIEVVSQNCVENAFFIERQNYYLGRPWPTKDGMTRLIRKDALVRWEGIVHEHAIVKGKTGILKNCFIHHTHRSLSEMVDKTNDWSVFEAKLRFENGHPEISWWRLLRVMFTGFWNSFVIQKGWKAGAVGWIESLYQAFSMFITYAKLWELQQTRDKKTV